MQMFNRGEAYKEVSLTVDDNSRILDDDVKTFQVLKRRCTVNAKILRGN